MNLTLALSLQLAGALIAGFALGFVHFKTLAGVSEAYLSGRAGRAVALHVVRIVAMIAGLVLLALLGAGPLLCGALGVLAGRAVVMRRARRLP